MHGNNGKKGNNDKWEDYGNKWGKKEDIIDCILNLKNMTVSYNVKNTNFGIAYNLNDKYKYRFVFQMHFQNDTIQIISETVY